MMNNLEFFKGLMNKVILKIWQKMLVKNSQCGNDIFVYTDIFVILLNVVLSFCIMCLGQSNKIWNMQV